MIGQSERSVFDETPRPAAELQFQLGYDPNHRNKKTVIEKPRSHRLQFN